MEITKKDAGVLYQFAGITEMYAETMVEKARNMELGLDSKAKMAHWRAMQDKAAEWREKFEAVVMEGI